MTIAIIYHIADYDGKLSNETCRHWLQKQHPDAVVHSYGWDYGRPVVAPCNWPHVEHDVAPVDWVCYDQIYIVDLSVDQLMERSDLQDRIIWIDHHKSAIEKWDKRPPGWTEGQPSGFLAGYRIDGVAACRLCWQWFFFAGRVDGLPQKEAFWDRQVLEPTLIRMAGEYDCWDHRDPAAKALQFGLRALSDEEWRHLLQEQFNGNGDMEFLGETIAEGRAIKTYCDRQNDEYSAAYSHTIQWEGLTFCALNIGQRGNSDLVRGGLKPEHDAIFAWRFTGRDVLVSLYDTPTRNDIDLSKIAVKYGGGGHRGACGFRLRLEALAEIFNRQNQKPVQS